MKIAKEKINPNRLFRAKLEKGFRRLIGLQIRSSLKFKKIQAVSNGGFFKYK